jgi:hypothetical protein
MGLLIDGNHIDDQMGDKIKMEPEEMTSQCDQVT